MILSFLLYVTRDWVAKCSSTLSEKSKAYQENEWIIYWLDVWAVELIGKIGLLCIIFDPMGIAFMGCLSGDPQGVPDLLPGHRMDFPSGFNMRLNGWQLGC